MNQKDAFIPPVSQLLTNPVSFKVRRRVNFEMCKSIYNEDMDRKINFILRKNRVEPFPGSS